MKYVASNEKYDYYIEKIHSTWYMVEINKETKQRALAGFTTKKVTLKAIERRIKEI